MNTQTLRFSLRDLILFSLPIIFGQLGQMLIGIGDSIVAAKYSTDTVAAVGIALGFVNPAFLFGLGILNGTSPLLSIKRGRGEEIKHYLNDCFWMSLFIFVFMAIATHLCALALPLVGIEERLIPLVHQYIDLIVWSFWPAYVFQVIKEFMQAKENVFFPNFVSIIFVFINYFFNYVLVFGLYGFSEMGIEGVAIASLVVRVFMAITMMWYLKFIPHLKLNFTFLKELFKFGLPIGAVFLFEVAAFSLTFIISGKFGSVEAATNTIVLQLSSLAFMVPLSLGIAVSVKVGYYYGKQNFKMIKNYIYSSLIIVSLSILITSLSFVVIPEFLIRIFTDDKEVIFLGVSLFVVIALFQVFDGIQAVLGGALRGLGMTKEVSYAATVSYWIIGIPIGFYLAFSLKLNTYGLWVGLALALALFACILITLLVRKSKTWYDE